MSALHSKLPPAFCIGVRSHKLSLPAALVSLVASLICISNSGTCFLGTVYYRLIKAVNDNGNPVSNLRYYPDLSLSPPFIRPLR